MPPRPGTYIGTRRCAVCGTFIREGVVCPEHRSDPNGARPRAAAPFRRTVEELPLEDMGIPRAYQRQIREHLVRKIIHDFDADLLGLLVVVRDGDGSLWILDGQHRWLALVELGHRTALCEVLHEVPLARQARIFSERNTRRLAPHPRDAFRADHAANEPDVVAIVRILQRHGYQPPFGTSKASARRFVCVGALREVHGWGLLERTLALIAEAWPDDDLATQAPILTGLGATLRLNPGVPIRDLARRLNRHTANEVLRLARGGHANSRERRLWVHVAGVVVELYNRGRTAAHRLPAPDVPYDATRQWKEGKSSAGPARSAE
jgi:hypothetical protein